MLSKAQVEGKLGQVVQFHVHVHVKLLILG